MTFWIEDQMNPHPRNARIILALDHLTLGDLEWFTAAARNASLGSEDRIELDVDDDGHISGIVIETSADDPA